MAFLYDAIVRRPLRELFLRGPHLFGSLGFWQNMDKHDICAEMTTTSSELWQRSPQYCEQVIDNRFESLHVLMKTVLLWAAVYKALALMMDLLVNNMSRRFFIHDHHNNNK
eukprot:jgi/Mesvir1/10812/Mv21208-RA.1